MTSKTEIFSGSISRLTNADFSQLSAMVYELSGIKMPISKKIMLECRLNKRLRALNMSSFKDYIQYVTSKEGMHNEIDHMIDEVTTNKTDFFREPNHFFFLNEQILPEFYRNEGRRTFKVWSAACSSGEEPYTIAIELQEFANQNRGFEYNIMASDISQEILHKAVMAIYPIDRISGVPLNIKQKYFLKSKDQIKPTVRVVPELRSKVKFFQVNLMDKILDVDGGFDVIFLRNVLIYFDRQTQFEVIRKICDKLRKGGFLFIGHSESLFQLDIPVRQVKPTIFQKL